MLELNAVGFAHVMARLREFQTVGRDAAYVKDRDATAPLTGQGRALAAQLVTEISAVMKGMDVRAALAACERLQYAIKKNLNLSFGDVARACEDIESRFRDELSALEAFYLEPEKASYYRADEPLFGDVVALKFPSIAYDLLEAGKCFALDRSTASAFHSIRCLEAGIRALSRCLGVPDPAKAAGRNWGAMLKAVKDAVDAKWPTSTDRLSGDGEFFDNAYASLAAMQNPWRNATMHLDQKYTEEEARHIFDVVGGFMRKLASRMDEDGLPKA